MNKSNLYLCVIGFSPGSSDSLTKVFSNFPKKTCNVSFLIQNSSPDFESNFPELLSLQTNYKVVKAKNEVTIKPGVVYITPPKHSATIKTGKIQLKKITAHQKQSLDTLFTSASAYKDKTIGVILTKSGTDGKEGLISIKNKGGFTITESLTGEGHKKVSLPANISAIAHLSLEPDEIATAIHQYIQKGQLKSNVKILQLQKELHETKKHLQSLIEEIKISNKELTIARRKTQMAFNELKELNNKLEIKEKSIRFTTNRFQTVLDNAKQGYLLVDKHFAIIVFNQAAEKFAKLITKRSLKKGADIQKIIPHQFIEEFKNWFQTARIVEKISINQHIINKQEKLWVQISGTPVYGENHRIESILISFIDLTAEKIAENKIEQSESRFHSIVEQFPYPVVTYAADGQSTGANTAWEILWNDKRENIKSYNIRKDPQLIQSGLSMYVEKAFAGEVALSEPYLYDPALIGHIGRKRWIQMLLYPVKEERNIVKEVILILQDVTDRKESEEKLEASEARFRALIEKSTDMMSLSIPHGPVIYVSPSIKTVLGYEPEEILGKLGAWVVRPDYIEDLVKSIDDIIVTPGKSFHRTIQVKHKNGSWRWIDGTVTNLVNEEGVNALVSNFRDVTEKKEAEELLHKSESNLKSLFNNTNTALILLDADFNIVLFNEIANWWAKQTLGTSYQEGINLISILPDDRKATTIKNCNHVLQGHVINYELQRPLVDGATRWFHVRQYPVRDSNSKVIGLCIASDEITERKIAEEALQQAEANYREIFEKGSDAIYIQDIETGKILDANERASEITGFTKEELLTLNPTDFLTEIEGFGLEDAKKHLQIATQGIRHVFEWMWKSKDGSNHWYEVSLSKATIAGVDRILAFFREIDNRKKAEEELKSFNQNLEQKVVERTHELEVSNKELEAFSYSVSHDLRAPLRAIQGYSKILEDENIDKLNDIAKQSLHYVQQNANKMTHQIDGLLKFSRLGRKEIVKHEINHDRLIQLVLDEFKRMMQRPVDIRLKKLEPAFADYNLLTHVWSNLLSNAIKYSSKKENPVIEIGSYAQEKESIFYIKDNGVGFNMEFSSTLFGVFQRLHPIDEFEGTGVGLAIVHRIITRHGGRIWAEAKQGEGATFYFSLPNSNLAS